MSLYQAALDSVEPRDTFMARVALTLRSHDISHAALAREIGVCPTQLSRWMRGQQAPCLESMLRVSAGLEEVLYHGR